MTSLPVGEPTIKTMQEQIAALRREIRSLQRISQEEVSTLPQEDRVIYSHPGEPEQGKSSPPYRYQRSSGYLTSVSISADTPGEETVVRVFTKAIGKTSQKDLATVTLDKDDDYTISDDLMGEVEDLDRVFVVMDQVGAGIADVTVTLVFMESVE